jgi:hypothetical protein
VCGRLDKGFGGTHPESLVFSHKKLIPYNSFTLHHIQDSLKVVLDRFVFCIQDNVRVKGLLIRSIYSGELRYFPVDGLFIKPSGVSLYTGLKTATDKNLKESPFRYQGFDLISLAP